MTVKNLKNLNNISEDIRMLVEINGTLYPIENVEKKDVLIEDWLVDDIEECLILKIEK